MNTQFFAGCTTVEEIKKLYRKLAMQYHPDRGGDTATMQAINAQYHAALKAMSGQKSRSEDGKEYTYVYREQAEEAVIRKIDEVLRSGILNRVEGCEFYLVGSWLWLFGDTYPHRKELGGLGFTWHSLRKAWVWHEKPYRGRRNPGSFRDIATKYGAERLAEQEEEVKSRKALTH